jgi:hypothetical protein
MIIARAAAGDAIWFKATIDRIADILAYQGDPNPVQVRRSKAIGILAQPAHALQLLYQHQHDPWDGPTEPADSDQEPEQESDLDQESAEDDIDADDGEADQSLPLSPARFDPDKARPRAIVYVHLSVEALTAGTGIARIEGVGPIVLSRLQMLLGDHNGSHCQINLKPVIDLPAGHIPIDCYEIPASLREQLLLRYPVDVFPYANTISRGVDIDHTIAYLSPDEGGPPGQTRIGNLGPHIRYHHRIKTHGAGRSANPNPAPGYGDHPTSGSTWSTPPDPIPSATPNSPRQSGAPPPILPQPLLSHRDHKISAWQALRDQKRVVLVGSARPVVRLVVTHPVLLMAVGQPL